MSRNDAVYDPHAPSPNDCPNVFYAWIKWDDSDKVERIGPLWYPDMEAARKALMSTMGYVTVLRIDHAVIHGQRTLSYKTNIFPHARRTEPTAPD